MKQLVLGLICGLCLCAVTSASFGQVETGEPSQSAAPFLLKPDALGFQPSSPETGDKLSLKIKKSDDVVSADVEWSINGEHVETSRYDGIVESVALLQAKIKGGDVIEAKVTPYDSSGVAGQPVIKIVNCRKAGPALKLANQKIEGDLYTAKVLATDPEGAPLTLSVSGPPGMVIDPNGTITWKMTKTTSGNFHIKVTAKDQVGTQAELTYSFRITRR